MLTPPSTSELKEKELDCNHFVEVEEAAIALLGLLPSILAGNGYHSFVAFSRQKTIPARLMPLKPVILSTSKSNTQLESSRRRRRRAKYQLIELPPPCLMDLK